MIDEHRIKEIMPRTVKKLLDKNEAVLFDVRDHSEYDSEHIEGAIPHSLKTLNAQEIQRISNGKKIIFHCASGKRAGMACKTFIKETGLDASLLKGSMREWKKSGLPTKLGVKKIPVEQQVMTIEGLFILIGLLLGLTISLYWLLLDAIIGAGILYAGISGKCMVTKMLKKLQSNNT
jgi:rhodanese-related sulfurtransferase